jgi:hypothetical protein
LRYHRRQPAIETIKAGSGWVELHKDELLADWDLATNGELPFRIEPLK